MAETPTFAVGESVQVAKTPSVSYWYIGPRQAKHRADSFGTVVARPCDISGDYTCVQFNDHDDDGQSQPVAIPTCDLVRHRPPNLEELRELLKDVEWQDLDEEADDELDARDATIRELRNSVSDAIEREGRLEMRCVQWYEYWMQTMGKNSIPDLAHERGIYEAGKAVIDGEDVANLPLLPVEQMAEATIREVNALEAKAARVDEAEATIKRLRRVADMVCIVNQTGDGTASRPGTQYVGLVVGSTLRLLSNGRGNSLLSERDVQEVAEAVNQAKEV